MEATKIVVFITSLCIVVTGLLGIMCSTLVTGISEETLREVVTIASGCLVFVGMSLTYMCLTQE